MDVDSLFARVLGRRWPWYMQMHLVYFSRKTLCEMLRREGFQIVDVRLHTPPRAAVVPRVAPRRLRSAAGAACSSPACSASVSASAPSAIKLGDIFTVIARKPTEA